MFLLPQKETLLKMFRFMAVGIPAFLIAIPLNIMLVERLQWPKAAAYALVLVVQVIINFFACVFFVFERDRSRTLRSQFAAFMAGILAARCMDWGLYSILVAVLPAPYLIIQLFNTLLFSLAKFILARKALECKPTGIQKT